jgi:hypothetical protein
MKKLQFLGILAVCALIAFSATPVFGQAVNYAQIQGRITDQSGAVIPGAQIKATQTATGLVRTTASNAEGQYLLPNLPVGPYQLRVTVPGFRDYVQGGIVLQVGEAPLIDIKLQVGAVSEVVQVEANAAMVETHQNSVSTVIDNSQIMELPLNGRNAPTLIMIAGAATNQNIPSQDLMSSKNYGNGTSGASQTVSVAGGQQNANNYLLDGADNNDAFSNVNAPFPFPDAIQEFSVQSSGLSARYGVHAGAVVNVVTKSGTNSFHGDVFEFLRNPAINAHHVIFTTPSASYRDVAMKRNQFGGTVGGPIKKDKLMFFLGYQGLRQDSSPAPTSAIVPTAAALAGDFTTMMSAGCKSGTAKTLKSPFVGNKVSPSLYNAQALALLKYVPVSADPCGSLSFTVPGIINEDQGVAKIDWSPSSKQTIFARYFITDARSPVPFDATNILPQGNTASQLSRFQSLVLGETYTLSPNMVNAIHLTATRMGIHRGPASGMINPTTIGINVPSPISAGLVLSVSSYFTTGGGSQMPGYFINNLFQVADDVDMTRGKHQLSFGGNIMRMQLNYLSTFQSNGQFTFSSTGFSGDNLADFMLGLPSTYAQGNPEAENWRYTYFGLYAHDNYRLLPNLTLNAGVRWEPFLPSQDALDRGSHFDYASFLAGVHSTVFPTAPAGLFFCGDAGIPCSFQNKKWLQFSPRVGLVWDPTKQGKMTIRASYGLFYDSPEMYYFDRFADNSPYGSGVSFSPKTTSGASLTNPYVGQTSIPLFPLPFPTAGSSNAYFPTNGVYINNSFDVHPMNVQSWNLSIERQFGANWMVSATYLGNKTTHLWAAYEANPGIATAVSSNALTGCTPGQAASTGNIACRRVLYRVNPSQGQYFSNMTTLWDGANAEYNGLLLSAKHRFSNNFNLLANYTWSHCISDQDFSGELTNSRPTLYSSPLNNPNTDNLKLDRGNCAMDVRQSMNVSLVVNSPKFEGKVSGAILNNWQLAPLVSYRTGTYFTVLTGVDSALQATTTSFKDRPNQVSDALQGSCTINGVTVPVGTTQCWFNTSAFASIASGTYGNVGRNSLSGPGAFTFDVAVSRRLKIHETKEVQLRWETFNLFNHPVYGNPAASLNNLATFGRIQSQIGDGRSFQGVIKISF